MSRVYGVGVVKVDWVPSLYVRRSVSFWGQGQDDSSVVRLLSREICKDDTDCHSRFVIVNGRTSLSVEGLYFLIIIK